jgi:hypothetical protein
MRPSIHYTGALIRHPDSGGDAVFDIEAHVDWTSVDTLSFRYRLRGDTSRLRIPEPRRARKIDGLWQHTCFEAFIASSHSPDYYEFNFSPSGEWAAYYFTKYRSGAPLPNQDAAPTLIACRADNCLDLHAIVPVSALTRVRENSRLCLGLCAVIEENSGEISYWALKHPPGRPNFHNHDGFKLEIEAPKWESLKK